MKERIITLIKALAFIFVIAFITAALFALAFFALYYFWAHLLVLVIVLIFCRLAYF